MRQNKNMNKYPCMEIDIDYDSFMPPLHTYR